MRTVWTKLGSAHDRLTSGTFVAAQFCLFVIVFSYSYEIVARYFFRAPTWWSNEIVAYALAIGTFLALPKVTRDGGHIAITFLIEILPVRRASQAQIAIALMAACVCLFVAWLCLNASITHIVRNEMIVRVRPIPKFWISIWLVYGFASSGLHFLRMAGQQRISA